MRNIVILEVAWGYGGPLFRINPRNFTGRRLYRFFGAASFLVTNACSTVVNSAREHAKPDPVTLRAVLRRANPSFVLVCGRVAAETFSADMVSASCVVMSCRHPAARTWTNEQMDAQAKIIEDVLRRT